ncbi:MAG: DUF805 domain-containing protein [Prevotellaceae bacterium]|jgi:uncharacterized membrane protein YhaH (DUF805 family)|nr:DUF805 domain-containing protein [Prevotellaceae bacterium]
MFWNILENPVFSKESRITRKKYAYFFMAGILYAIVFMAFQILFPDFHLPEFIEKNKYSMAIFGILIFSPFLILVAKSVQRCHDLGVNGFYQLIPFFFLFMLFIKGQNCPNRYGKNPSKEETDKITLLNRGMVSVAINKTATFQMFLILLALLLFVIIAISLI